jgi:protease secretion system outer membrane protein
VTQSHVALLSRTSGLLAAAGVFLAASPTQALQPLSDFFTGARKVSPEMRQAALVGLQRDAETLSAYGQLMPSLGVTGTYTLNQYEAAIGTGADRIVVQPQHGLSASAQLSIPLLDLASWKRMGASKLLQTAAQESLKATELEVERQVAQFYFQLVGSQAIRQSHQASLAFAERSAETARAKRDEGTATDLDVARSEVETETLKRTISDQELAMALARRALSSITGIDPTDDAPVLTDDLHEEASLVSWEAKADDVASVRSARALREASERQASAARWSLVPTVGATATEQASNAAGFVGQNAYFTGMVTASWRLDVPTLARIRGQDVAAGSARVQEEKARTTARDAVHEAWQRVRSGIVAGKATRAQAAAAKIALDAARERYAAGSSTQLDIIQAQRDWSSSEAARIQSDANLGLARIQLRLAAGES